MFKKILTWSIYAGVVGLLIFGAVIRTQAKAGDASSPEGSSLESRISEGNQNGGQGNGPSGEEAERQGGTGNGSGSGSNALNDGRGDEAHLAEDEDHDNLRLSGVVASLDVESLWIDIDREESLEVTGRTWRYIVESGLAVSVGDEMELDGFYEEGEFEVSYLSNLTSGDSLQIREDSGRPLWSGGAGR